MLQTFIGHCVSLRCLVSIVIVQQTYCPEANLEWKAILDALVSETHASGEKTKLVFGLFIKDRLDSLSEKERRNDILKPNRCSAQW